MEDVVDSAHVERFADVSFYKLESGFIFQMGEVSQTAGEEVVDGNYPPAFGEQGIAEVGTEKSSATGDERTLLWSHAFLPFLETAAGTPSGCEAGRPTL